MPSSGIALKDGKEKKSFQSVLLWVCVTFKEMGAKVRLYGQWLIVWPSGKETEKK